MPLVVSQSWIDPFSFSLEVNPILDFQRTFNVLKVSTIAEPKSVNDGLTLSRRQYNRNLFNIIRHDLLAEKNNAKLEIA
jgi:hypothetical protein